MRNRYLKFVDLFFFFFLEEKKLVVLVYYAKPVPLQPLEPCSQPLNKLRRTEAGSAALEAGASISGALPP